MANVTIIEKWCLNFVTSIFVKRVFNEHASLIFLAFIYTKETNSEVEHD